MLVSILLITCGVFLLARFIRDGNRRRRQSEWYD